MGLGSDLESGPNLCVLDKSSTPPWAQDGGSPQHRAGFCLSSRNLLQLLPLPEQPLPFPRTLSHTSSRLPGTQAVQYPCLRKIFPMYPSGLWFVVLPLPLALQLLVSRAHRPCPGPAEDECSTERLWVRLSQGTVRSDLTQDSDRAMEASGCSALSSDRSQEWESTMLSP